MAWRQCIHPGCKRRKPVQPWYSNKVHPWLCSEHRLQKQNERIEHLARVADARRALAKIMSLKA